MKQMMDPGSGLHPDLITFSTLLKGYCHNGEIDKALRVSETIRERGLRCDELVYNTLMDGCVKANDQTTGVGLFEEMISYGMKPSAITHSILVRLYKKAGYDQQAVEAVAQLYQHHGLDKPFANADRGGRGLGRRDRDKGRGSPNNGFRGRQYRGPWSQDDTDGPPESPMPLEHYGHEWGTPGSSFHEGDGTPMGSPFLPIEAVRSPGGMHMLPPFPGSGPGTPGSCTPGSSTPGSSWNFGVPNCGLGDGGTKQLRSPMQGVCVPKFPGSGSGTPGSCTPGGSWFGDGSSVQASPMTQAAMPQMMPPWPPASAFAVFPQMNMMPMGMNGSSGDMPTIEAALLPSCLLECSDGPAPSAQINGPSTQTDECTTSHHISLEEAREEPREGSESLPASPDRSRCPCPGTPEQYASYPMPDTPSPGGCTMPVMGQCAMQGMPQGMPQGMAQGMPQGMPQGMQQPDQAYFQGGPHDMAFTGMGPIQYGPVGTSPQHDMSFAGSPPHHGHMEDMASPMRMHEHHGESPQCWVEKWSIDGQQLQQGTYWGPCSGMGGLDGAGLLARMQQ